MARTKREQSPIGIHHVLLKSDETLFLSDEDKGVFEELCVQYFPDGTLYSLAFMQNYVHMVFADGGAGASAVIKPLTTSYARYYNRTYSREGKLFEGRFRSEAAQTNADALDFAVYVDSIYGASRVCAKDAFFKSVCSEKEYKKRMNAKLERVCIDAFDRFSDKDIFDVICRINGVSPDDAKKLSDSQRREMADASLRQKWVSARRVAEALGIKAAVKQPDKGTAPSLKEKNPKTAKKPSDAGAQVKPTPAPPKEPEQKKQNLSVWLL